MAGAAGAVMARTRPSVTPTFLRRVCDLPRVLPVHRPFCMRLGLWVRCAERPARGCRWMRRTERYIICAA